MTEQDLKHQPQKQPDAIRPEPPKKQVQPTGTKPDKNVVVPKYDLLTEGYDPAKLKNRKP